MNKAERVSKGRARLNTANIIILGMEKITAE